MPSLRTAVVRAVAGFPFLVLAGALVGMYRASTALLRPRRIVRPDAGTGVPGMLPFAYNWPTAHPMSVIGPWPWQPQDGEVLPVRPGDDVVSVDGMPLSWDTWRTVTRHLRDRGAGAHVQLCVRRAGAGNRLIEVEVTLDAEVWLPSDLGLAYREVRYRTRTGDTLVGWFLPGGRGRSPTVVALHGMAASRHSMLIAFGYALVRAGYNVFIPDAGAHGESPGLNTDLVGIEEVRATLHEVRRQPEADPDRIVLLGHSYGGVKALVGAAAVPGVAAVVTVAAPLTVEQGIKVVATRIMRLPPSLVAGLMPMLSLWVRLRTGNWLGDADALTAACRWEGPLLVIQGEFDELWPPDTARILYNAGMGRRDLLLIPGVDHNGVLVAGNRLQQPLLDFLRRVMERPSGPSQKRGVDDLQTR